MKNTKKCPKCAGTKIIRVNGTVGAYGAGNNIPLGMTNFSAVKVHRYLCMNCGFIEEWVDQKDLHRIENSSKAIQL